MKSVVLKSYPSPEPIRYFPYQPDIGIYLIGLCGLIQIILTKYKVTGNLNAKALRLNHNH
ncbi:MAG: hypothetical protein NDF54_01005 [archaeon GB-1867-035]|nr:hypothetical protein [Candidatus Culexmicrobium profundum]